MITVIVRIVLSEEYDEKNFNSAGYVWHLVVVDWL